MRNARRFSPRPAVSLLQMDFSSRTFLTEPQTFAGVEGTLPEVPSKEARSIKGGEGSTAEVSGRFGTPASFLLLLALPGLFPRPSSLPAEPTEIPDLGFILNCIQSVCV